jgi:NADH-quinone oxidoreductase subunit G
MLSAVSRSSRFSRFFNVPVNGVPLAAVSGETVLELCDRNNIKIPRLCHHPNLPPRASCRICLVECNGKWLSPACVTTVWDGLVIDTRTPAVETAVRGNLKLLLESHDERCTSCVANGSCDFRDLVYEYGADSPVREPPFPTAVETSTKAIQLDPSKCVLCGRCIRACEFITGQKAIQFTSRASHMAVEPAGGLPLSQTNCVQCGQCTLYCPVGAITEKNDSHAVITAVKTAKSAVAYVDPSLFGSLASSGQIVTALKRLGFSKVLNAASTSSSYVAAEAATLLARLESNSLPLYSSYCTAWSNFLSKGSSVSQKVSNAKPTLPQVSGSDYSVVIGSCLAKKGVLSGVNAVLSARELIQILRIAGVNLTTLPPTEFDGDAGSAALAASGGLSSAIAKAAAVTDKLNFAEVSEGIKVATATMKGKSVRFALVDGILNATRLAKAVDNRDAKFAGLAFVEVNACPGGCVAGGGSPPVANSRDIAARVGIIQKLA